MSVYFVKGKDKGWRYDFTLKGIRYTGTWFKTKAKAKEAEARQKEALKNPQPITPPPMTPAVMDFLALVNKRLDHVKAYNSERHYTDHIYLARRWVKAVLYILDMVVISTAMSFAPGTSSTLGGV